MIVMAKEQYSEYCSFIRPDVNTYSIKTVILIPGIKIPGIKPHKGYRYTSDSVGSRLEGKRRNRNECA